MSAEVDQFRLSSIARIAITVSDVERALTFYRDILVLQFLFRAGPQLAAELPDHALWTGFLRDPDGNLVGLLENKPLP